MDNWDSNFGYYELNNDTKYSISKHPKTDSIYVRGAHFGWYKVDPNDHMDYPPTRVQLARENPGKEIMLTSGGHREVSASIEASSGNEILVTTSGQSESIDLPYIPVQFRQSTYDCNNGCVWLSACLLINSVDSILANKMISRYENDEVMFEWLDIFKRQKRNKRPSTIYNTSNLHEQLRHVRH